MLAMVVATALVGGLWPAVLARCAERPRAQLLVRAAHRHPDHRRPRERVRHRGVRARPAWRSPRWWTGAARRTQQAVRARTEANAWPCSRTACCTPGTTRSQLLRQACEVVRHDRRGVACAPATSPRRRGSSQSGGNAPIGRRRPMPGLGCRTVWTSSVRGRPLRSRGPQPADRVRGALRRAATSGARPSRGRAGPEAGRGQPDPDRAAGRGLPRPAQPAGGDQGGDHQPAQHRDRLVRRGRARSCWPPSRSRRTGWTPWWRTCST